MTRSAADVAGELQPGRGNPKPASAPVLLGVVNVSPESMVRGSIARTEDEIHDRAAMLASFGVGIIDLGGRSITPDAPTIDDDEEQRRLLPALRSLRGGGHRVSVDTWSNATGMRVLEDGCDWLNFTGQDAEPRLLEAAAAHGSGLMLTYMPYGDAYRMRDRDPIPYSIERILSFFGPRVERAQAAGVERLAIDPNLGIIHPSTDDFAKIHLQYEVLSNADRLRTLGCPLLMYAARKPERLARIMMAEAVLRAGADFIRTHEPEILVNLIEARGARQ